MISAFPAFIVGALIVSGLGRVGVNEVLSFMLLVPPLIFAWYYFLGWSVDRWRRKRSQQS